MSIHERILDFDNPALRVKVANGVNKLRGQWRMTLVRYRPRRSDRQNRYYWPCFVQPFAAWLKEQGHDANDDIAHEMLKVRFLRRPVVDKESGEMIGEYTESTTKLDTVEFNEYLDNVARFLAEFCEIVVPEPSEYREKEAA